MEKFDCRYFLKENFANWNPEKFDWANYSDELPKMASRYFDIWWDNKRFNWDKSHKLARFCEEKIYTWWDANKFNWQDGSYELACHCHKYFNLWWDKDKFNWAEIKQLIESCQDNFDTWYDPEKIDWEKHSFYLAYYAGGLLKKWWDSEKFNWEEIEYLIERCIESIEIWWDIEKVIKHIKPYQFKKLLEAQNGFLSNKEILKLKLLKN